MENVAPRFERLICRPVAVVNTSAPADLRARAADPPWRPRAGCAPAGRRLRRPASLSLYWRRSLSVGRSPRSRSRLHRNSIASEIRSPVWARNSKNNRQRSSTSSRTRSSSARVIALLASSSTGASAPRLGCRWWGSAQYALLDGICEEGPDDGDVVADRRRRERALRDVRIGLLREPGDERFDVARLDLGQPQPALEIEVGDQPGLEHLAIPGPRRIADALDVRPL